MDLGTMRDTFDTVINRLIKDAEKWRIFKEKVLPRFLHIRSFTERVEDKEIGAYFKEIFEKAGLLEE